MNLQKRKFSHLNKSMAFFKTQKYENLRGEDMTAIEFRNLVTFQFRQKGVTREKVAHSLDISIGHFSDCLNGRVKPSHDLALKIAKFYATPPEKFWPELFAGHNQWGFANIRNGEPYNDRQSDDLGRAIMLAVTDPDKMTRLQCEIISQKTGYALFRLFPGKFDRNGSEIPPKQQKPAAQPQTTEV